MNPSSSRIIKGTVVLLVSVGVLASLALLLTRSPDAHDAAHGFARAPPSRGASAVKRCIAGRGAVHDLGLLQFMPRLGRNGRRFIAGRGASF
jgi:predicted carbohydrate-binding protein with CBM5 and CBM33 domain